MKKLLLLLAALAGTLLAARAQTTIGKGTGLLTGAVGYHSETNDVTVAGSGSSPSYNSTFTYSTFKLDFAVGGFVANNLALGLQLSHTVAGGSAKSSTNSQPPSPPSPYTLRVGPVAQYYKMLGEQFGLTATLGAGYESDMASRQYTQYVNGYPYYFYTSLKATGLYTALTPGIVFFPVPKFGLTATMGSLAYSRLKVKNISQTSSNPPDETASSFDAGFGFSQLQFGGHIISDINKGGCYSCKVLAANAAF